MSRYVVVVIRDSDPVALGTNFLASRRNNLAKKKELGRFVGTEFAVLGFLSARSGTGLQFAFARMENLFQTARTKQLRGSQMQKKSKSGNWRWVVSRHSKYRGDVERNRGATGRQSESRFFRHWN